MRPCSYGVSGVRLELFGRCMMLGGVSGERLLLKQELFNLTVVYSATNTGWGKLPFHW
ncbi:hypothetical protein Ancab_012618, partial [Ancistrocladus abbreviatus]